MKTNAKMMVIGLVLAVMFCYASIGLAETANGAASAAVRLNFRIVIANYIEFQVGDALSIGEVVFSPTTDEIIGSTEIAGTGGDLFNGVVTVKLLSNTPTVTITATNDGGGNGLWDGGTEYIDYANILTNDLGGALTPPILDNTGGTVSTDSLVGPQNIDTQWTYTYKHVAVDAPLGGSYTGEVTYTASTP